MKIDQTIINDTIHCENNFECLKKGNHPCVLMKVDTCISNKVLFVHCTETTCHYRMIYGNSTICNCPVRKEIYNKYEK